MNISEFDRFAKRMSDAWRSDPHVYTECCQEIRRNPVLCLRMRDKPGIQNGTEQLLLELHASEADALCAGRNHLEMTQHLRMAVILEVDPPSEGSDRARHAYRPSRSQR